MIRSKAGASERCHDIQHAVFFVFFVVYFGLHFAVPREYRLLLIIAGSSVFYACGNSNTSGSHIS